VRERLKDWKTIPIRLRTWSRSVSGSQMSMFLDDDLSDVAVEAVHAGSRVTCPTPRPDHADDLADLDG